MRFTGSIAFAGALCLTAPLPGADDTVRVNPDTRVRLTVKRGGGPLVGTILALDETTVTLKQAGQANSTVLRREDITAVAVSAGRRSRGKGALIGAAIGAGSGAVIGVAAGLASGGSADEQGLEATVGGVFLAFLGGSMGALIGLAVPPADRWKEVPADRIRLSLTPVRGRGLAISLAIAF